MKLTLPPRPDGSQTVIKTRRLTIVGANGAGKSRFAAAIAENCGERAFRMSAMNAIFGRNEDPAPHSVDSLYHEAVGRSPLIRNDIDGGFERLVALLVNDTALQLLAENIDGDRPGRRKPVLMQIIDNWQQIFPGNKMLLTCGRLIVDTGNDNEPYPASRLSAGEKAVLYNLGAALLAPHGAAIFVDAPEMFLHTSIMRPLWDRIERLRPDCTFIYTTHDLGFAGQHTGGDLLWVKHCDTDRGTWSYEALPETEGLPEDVYLAILGDRKPVLFIEGDARHSYDARLYPLIFPEYTIKPLGSCDRVIEATRTFNSLKDFHNLAARGIVDRDRRDDKEVEYLRTRNVLVPDVAEIENIFMIEEVVRAIAALNGRDPNQAFGRVRRNLLSLFGANIERQALEHTRHKIKVFVQHRIDGRFNGIDALEQHLDELTSSVDARGLYQEYLGRFEGYHKAGDYRSVLRVFNYKSMLAETRVSSLTGSGNDDRRTYIETVLGVLHRADTDESRLIRDAIRRVFDID